MTGHNHGKTYTMRKSPEDRFFEKTKKDGDCLIWTGYADKDGYGRFLYNRRTQIVNRVAYIIYHGEESLIDKVKITTSCGNRLCVAKEHVILIVTNSDKLGAKYKASENKFAVELEKITISEFYAYKEKYGEPDWRKEKILMAAYVDYFYTFTIDKNAEIRGKVRVWKDGKYDYYRQGGHRE